MPYTGDQKRIYAREWKKARRDAWIAEHGPCIRCGTWLHLEVDHIDPKTKEANISQIWSWSEARREAELAKCQVLCEPCHTLKTILDAEKVPGRSHGVSSTYSNGCRCRACTKAHSAKMAAYRIKVGHH